MLVGSRYVVGILPRVSLTSFFASSIISLNSATNPLYRSVSRLVYDPSQPKWTYKTPEAPNVQESQLHYPEEQRAPIIKQKISLQSVNDISPEIEILSKLLPEEVPLDELDVIEKRIRAAKQADKTPSAADCLWSMLANLKLGHIDRAIVAWNSLQAQTVPMLLHWNMIMAYAAKSRDHTSVADIYEKFKLEVIKRRLPRPTPITHNILTKSLSERGDIVHSLEVYEDMFSIGSVPQIHHLKSILKCAAAAGDPKSFHRFYRRLRAKNVPLKPSEVKPIIDSWGKRQVDAQWLKRQHVTTGDFAYCMEYALRVHNYSVAIKMILHCRDTLGIQPDARMYEVLLNACLRDGFLLPQATEWKKRFKKYPKGIEVRSEHFEFGEFIDSLQSKLGQSSTNAKPIDRGEQFNFSRTTRKRSRGLYHECPIERYDSGYKLDMYEWVPTYVERKQEIVKSEDQSSKAAELAEIVKKAREQVLGL